MKYFDKVICHLPTFKEWDLDYLDKPKKGISSDRLISTRAEDLATANPKKGPFMVIRVNST